MKTLQQKTSNLRGILMLSGASLLALQSCITIEPGEVGLKVRRGTLSEGDYAPGRYRKGPNTDFVVFSTRVKELDVKTVLPTREGLEAKVTLTMLYHISPESVRNIYLKLGMGYENEVVLNNLLAISRETCLKYKAMDLLTQRDSLEAVIFRDLKSDISHYGFVVDQVLVRDIDVPDEIDRAIEKKVLSEQLIKQQEVDILTQKKATDANIEKQRKEMEFNFEKQKREIESKIQQEKMEIDFSIEKQKKEAERTVIEAEAAKKAQDLANAAITPMLIRLKSIEIMKSLANSPNQKIIITDGKTPINFRFHEAE